MDYNYIRYFIILLVVELVIIAVYGKLMTESLLSL